MIGSKLYDTLKFLAQILVPALGTLYVALAAIYNWGHVDEVAGTVVAVDTFLGVLVSYLKLKYDASDKKYDGEINVIERLVELGREGFTGAEDECLAYIEETWTDMRPLSLRRWMDDQQESVAG